MTHSTLYIFKLFFLASHMNMPMLTVCHTRSSIHSSTDISGGVKDINWPVCSTDIPQDSDPILHPRLVMDLHATIVWVIPDGVRKHRDPACDVLEHQYCTENVMAASKQHAHREFDDKTSYVSLSIYPMPEIATYMSRNSAGNDVICQLYNVSGFVCRLPFQIIC